MRPATSIFQSICVKCGANHKLETIVFTKRLNGVCVRILKSHAKF